MNHLFTPMQVNGLTLKNRVVMAPMCQYSSDNTGQVKEWHLIHYTTRAIGNVGLIILEATAVEPRGRISPMDLGIWEDSQISGLKDLVEKCRSYGAKVGIQLAHAGRKSTVTDEPIVAPSAVPFSDEYATPHALTETEIAEVTLSFQQAARRAVEAGFDLIEIHGAHGYLINEFLSPLSNFRQDGYGGSPENRVRLLKEVTAAVREVVPADYPVTVRVSAEDYEPEGNHPEELAQMLLFVKGLGIDLVNVSSGAVTPAKILPYPGYQVGFSEKIRSITGIPTIAGGLITSPEMANEIILNQRGDLVYLGRELLRNPYWALLAPRQIRQEVPWPTQYQRAK